MENKLQFDATKYEIKTCTLEQQSVTYRAYLGIDYCTAPKDPIQKLNIFVPDIYYHGQCCNGYDLHSAPIFMPNSVGGYMPGPAEQPGLHRWKGVPNSLFHALVHGYVVVSAGVRGRTSVAEDGRSVGRAPALIVDLKAAIRYLRYNRSKIPGNVEKIITSGTSAGGALSALAGSTGNSSDYEPYLQEIGAANAADHVFAANCYCPIHNLENSDTAYEWQFFGHNTCHYKMRSTDKDGNVVFSPMKKVLTQEQLLLSQSLKAAFPAYLNRLGLVDEQGNKLTLSSQGEGSFLKFVHRYIIVSAQKALDHLKSEHHLSATTVPGSEVDSQPFFTIENGKITAFDWDGYLAAITRMKSVPAFDTLDLNSPENDEFGNAVIGPRHFTHFSKVHSHAHGEMTEATIVRLLNPLEYIHKADTAKHWRIRHGTHDRDTSLAIPIILATFLKNRGYDVDFSLPWGVPHSGDYDLKELFSWIDKICSMPCLA